MNGIVDSQQRDNLDLKKNVSNLQDKVASLEGKLNHMYKENDDLKYDNTLLYEKNVEKDRKLQDSQD